MLGAKRGQSNAAILVGLIALLIILYVLFLPPDQRNALLGEGQPGTTPGTGGSTSNILFTSPVGVVHLAVAPEQRHEIPSVGIRASEQGSILAQRDSLTAANNAFEKKPTTITFPADPDHTRNPVLSFNLASKTGGNVIVKLNGQEVFNQEVNSRSVSPITLPSFQDTNELTFESSSVGFAFWRTNTYTATNVKITADVTDLSAATSRQSFALGAQEYATMQSAVLSFVPVCDKAGIVTIAINGLDIYSGTPDCDNLNTLEIAPGKLNSGDNSIAFSTQQASLTIDRPALVVKSKQEDNRVFSFTIDPASVQGRQVGLRLLFPDASTHDGVIKLNGNTIPLRAQDLFGIQITNYLRAGQNTIQFQAIDKEFEIVKLDVLLN